MERLSATGPHTTIYSGKTTEGRKKTEEQESSRTEWNPIRDSKDTDGRGTRAILGIMNKILTTGEVPSIWKRARLTLLRKNPSEDIAKYRPLYLLDTMGKLMEAMILGRLQENIEAKGGLNNNQYGFRKQRSTEGATKETIATAEEAREEAMIRDYKRTSKPKDSVTISMDL